MRRTPPAKQASECRVLRSVQVIRVYFYRISAILYRHIGTYVRPTIRSQDCIHMPATHAAYKSRPAAKIRICPRETYRAADKSPHPLSYDHTS